MRSTPTPDTTTPMTRTRTRGGQALARAGAVVLGIALTATACRGPRPEVVVDTAPSTTATTVETAISPVDTTIGQPEISPTPIRAISTVETLQVFAQPNSTVTLALLSERTDFGSARVLLVKEIVDGWVRVQLPIRPNETSGWVRADDVTLETIDALVEVDLDARTITTWVDGEILLTSSVMASVASSSAVWARDVLYSNTVTFPKRSSDFNRAARNHPPPQKKSTKKKKIHKFGAEF